MLAIACNAQKTEDNKVVSGEDSTTIAANNAKTGADKDEHGCIGSAGYTWSVLKNDCIRTFNHIKLMPLEKTGTYSSAAFLLFSDDKSKAELFMPGEKESLILERTANETGNWKKDDLEIIADTGYVLKQAGKEIYSGK